MLSANQQQALDAIGIARFQRQALATEKVEPSQKKVSSDNSGHEIQSDQTVEATAVSAAQVKPSNPLDSIRSKLAQKQEVNETKPVYNAELVDDTKPEVVASVEQVVEQKVEEDTELAGHKTAIEFVDSLIGKDIQHWLGTTIVDETGIISIGGIKAKFTSAKSLTLKSNSNAERFTVNLDDFKKASVKKRVLAFLTKYQEHQS